MSPESKPTPARIAATSDPKTPSPRRASPVPAMDTPTRVDQQGDRKRSHGSRSGRRQRPWKKRWAHISELQRLQPHVVQHAAVGYHYAPHAPASQTARSGSGDQKNPLKRKGANLSELRNVRARMFPPPPVGYRPPPHAPASQAALFGFGHAPQDSFAPLPTAFAGGEGHHRHMESTQHPPQYARSGLDETSSLASMRARPWAPRFDARPSIMTATHHRLPPLLDRSPFTQAPVGRIRARQLSLDRGSIERPSHRQAPVKPQVDGKGGADEDADDELSDRKDSDEEDSDEGDSTEEGSDEEGSDEERSERQDSDKQDSDEEGLNEEGSEGQDSEGQDSEGQDSDGEGSDGEGSDGEGSEEQGSEEQDSDEQDSDEQDSDEQDSDEQDSDEQDQDEQDQDEQDQDEQDQDEQGPVEPSSPKEAPRNSREQKTAAPSRPAPKIISRLNKSTAENDEALQALDLDKVRRSQTTSPEPQAKQRLPRAETPCMWRRIIDPYPPLQITLAVTQVMDCHKALFSSYGRDYRQRKADAQREERLTEILADADADTHVPLGQTSSPLVPSPMMCLYALPKSVVPKVQISLHEAAERRFSLLERAFACRIRRWVDQIASTFQKESSAQIYDHFKHQVSFTPTREREQWTYVAERSLMWRQQSIIRLHEICFGLLERIRAERKDEREWKGLGGEDVVDPTWRFRAPRTSWPNMSKFWKALHTEQGATVKKLWLPIIQIHYGLEEEDMDDPLAFAMPKSLAWLG